MANSITDLIRITDRHNFEKNNFTIIRLQAKNPLPIEFIREIQMDGGLVTTRIGNFTWTKFETWETAFQFYAKYHNWRHHDQLLTGCPQSHPQWEYEELVEHMEEIGKRYGFTSVSIPVIGPIMLSQNVKSTVKRQTAKEE